MRMSELWADMQRPPILPSDEEVKRAGEKMLRDKIAIAAMQSLLLRDDWKDHPVSNIAQASYIYADEMLAARESK